MRTLIYQFSGGNIQLLDEVVDESENYYGQGLYYLHKPKAEVDNKNWLLDHWITNNE